MALNKSSLLIRDYENIRHILRDIYIYGCFSRDDYIEKRDISGRKYDKEQQRIRAYLPEKFIKKRRVNKRVLMYCEYSAFDGADNHLADTYRNKSFTALDIMSYFFVQELLFNRGELAASEILDNLPAINENAIFTKDNLRVKLDELVSKGIIGRRKENRKTVYYLPRDIWSDFEDGELLDLYAYLDFMKAASPVGMPYFFLQQKLKLYLACDRKIETADRGIFQFKHNHLFCSLDNDVLLEIMKAVYGKCRLSLKRIGENKTMEVIPGEVIHDSLYGRQYLYCHAADDNRKMVLRIDKIAFAQAGERFSGEDQLESDEMQNFSQRCWCTSSSGRGRETVVEFRFDEEKEKYILKRLQEEGHGGTIVKKEKDVYEFRITLEDPNEMVPWIRSFGERARVISSEGAGTEENIAADWERAVKKYAAL